MFGNVGFGEMLLILGVLLLVFGAKRLPEIGSSIGRGIREFKRSVSDIQGELTNNDPSLPRAGTPLDQQQMHPPTQSATPVQPVQVAPPKPPRSD